MGGMSKRVGIIGVGLLGGALGQRLAGQGWEVLGHDPAVAELDGLTMCGSAVELAGRCDPSCFRSRMPLPPKSSVRGQR